MKGSNFTLTLCTFLLFTSVSARLRKEKERKKLPSKISPMGVTSNLCSIEGNNAPFHCFCSDGTATTNATKAKCWVFSGLTRDHSLWSLFATQPLISELNIMVTPMGEFGFIPTKGLQHLKEVQSLTIVYGSIEDVHPYAFANLTKIYEIILARNRIVTLSHYAFAHLTNLSTLDLDENRISELNREVFIDLPALKKLFLKQNNLSVIQEGAFRQLGHLIELELSHNSINVLTKDTFAGLGELKKLMLANNKIVMLGDLTFAELWVLEELDLEANQIEFISDRAFAGLTHLWRLNLSYNKLKSLRGTLLDGVPAVINFDLRHNNLETLTFDNMKPILHNFYNDSGYFYLSSNDFVCDCRLAWMHILRNETKNQLIRDALDQLTCHMEMDEDEEDIPAASLFSTKSQTVNNALLEDEDPSLNPLNAEEGEFEEDYYEDDDDYQQQESLHHQMSNDPTVQRLLQIPLNQLPCVEESKAPTQTPRHVINTPAYAEINASGCAPLGINVLLSVWTLIWFCLT